MIIANSLGVLFLIALGVLTILVVTNRAATRKAEAAYYTLLIKDYDPILNLDYRTKEILQLQAILDKVEFSIIQQPHIIECIG